jgi:16S rRNA (guanine527-N7)-methyltransferase
MPSSLTWEPLADLTVEQLELLTAFEQLIVRANKRVNLVSRRSVTDIRQAHSRHSLVLSLRDFPTGTTVVDWGTGGGLPGIPLAIRFPQVQFVLIDSIRKKTDLLNAISMKIGLDNVTVENARAEDWTGACDYAVSRATAPLADLWAWTNPVLRPNTGTRTTSSWNEGLLALKGGDLSNEIDELRSRNPQVGIKVTPLNEVVDGHYDDKFIVEVSSSIH